MTRDEIAPMVPMLGRPETTDEFRTDGGVRSDAEPEAEVDAPFVPDLR